MSNVLASLSRYFFAIAFSLFFLCALIWTFEKTSKFIKAKFKVEGFKVEVLSVVLVMMALSLICFTASKWGSV